MSTQGLSNALTLEVDQFNPPQRPVLETASSLLVICGFSLLKNHKDDLFLIESLEEQGKKYNFSPAESFETSRFLEGGDEVKIGNQTFGVRHCPGHTPGHIIFFHEETKLAAVGDVLFQGSIGRSDLPRGNHQQLVDSIVNELWPLGDEMRFIPGHGPMSTFGNERLTNPYVSDFALGIDREVNEALKKQEETRE